MSGIADSRNRRSHAPRLRRGLTLTELLVATAIAVVLGSALFPVLAAVRQDDKSASAANFGMVARGIALYVSDHDGRLPKAHSVNLTTGSERWNYKTPVPYGWYAKTCFRNALRQMEHVNFWANAVYPYVENSTAYELPGIPTVPSAGADYESSDNKPRIKVGMAYNGLLHALPSVEVAQPGVLPLIWPGLFKQNLDGFGLSNPVLYCDGPTAGDPCHFKPLDPPQFRASQKQYGAIWWGFSAPGVNTVWVYGQGFHVASVDTSVRFIEVQAPTWPAAALTNAHPFSSLASREEHDALPGQPFWLAECVAPGRSKAEGLIRYPGFFRPDSEFNYTESQCDIGNG